MFAVSIRIHLVILTETALGDEMLLKKTWQLGSCATDLAVGNFGD